MGGNGYDDDATGAGELESVAHDLNNLIATALLNVELLRNAHVEGPPRLNAAAHSASAALMGLRELVAAELLGRCNGHSQAVDLQSVVDAAVQLVQVDLARVATIDRHFSGDVLPVLGRRHRLLRLFVNLLVNATKAMRQNPGRDSHRVDVSCRRVGDDAVVEISDTGVGVPASERDRVFSPRFSTNGGRGIGLMICRDIVTSLGGTIACQGRDGDGTTFVVRLPAANDAS